MKVAVEGCCHGQLDAIYAAIASLEARNNYKVSLLLICGDFQAVRNESDLLCMSVPDKYKELGEFWKYYTGEKVAPILTIIIGGNHEASNYFWELFHGGWIAPNMYFLGNAGCVQVNGIRIAGASGIFGGGDFHQGFWERTPYHQGSMRSAYHIREYNIRRLSLLTPAPTIFLSHDWPQNIVHHGNLPRLLRSKPFFKRDIETGKLGSPPMWGLLGTLKPGWWFSAHLHVRFEAKVVWEEGALEEESSQQPAQGTATKEIVNPDEIQIDDFDVDDDTSSSVPAPLSKTAPPNPEEIQIADDEFEDVPSSIAQQSIPAPPRTPNNGDIQLTDPEEILIDDIDGEEAEVAASLEPPPEPAKREWGDGKGWPATHFLALDKCLPRRQFLEIVDIPEPKAFTQRGEDEPPVLTFDPEWLAITRALNPFMSTIRNQSNYPDEAEARAAVERELHWVRENVLGPVGSGEDAVKEKRVEDCQTFVATAPGPENPGKKFAARVPPKHFPNPQTAAFCTMLGIENKIDR